MKVLLAIVHLAPMTGLLGTVIGMISLFHRMSAEGSFLDTRSMATALWPALISTAAGLTVAIVAYGFYMYLVERIELIVADMEKAACEVLFLLTDLEISLDDSPAQKAVADARAASRPDDADLAAPAAN
jgi:biopolymer transport protein ExbB